MGTFLNILFHAESQFQFLNIDLLKSSTLALQIVCSIYILHRVLTDHFFCDWQSNPDHFAKK